MSRFLSIAALILLTATIIAEPVRPEVGPLVQGNNAFAIDLFGRLRQKEGNVVFSPYGVSSALALTSWGARGRTQDELNRTVHLLDPERLHPAYQALNETVARADNPKGAMRMIIQSDLRGYRGTVFTPAFLDVARQSYGARRDVGDHVDTNLSRLAKQDVANAAADPLPARPNNDETLPLTLISVVRLEAGKEAKLPEDSTPGAPFTLADGKQVSTRFLQQKGLFAYGEDKGTKVVELPFADSDLRLVLLLPGKTADLPQLEKSLDLEILTGLVNRTAVREVEIKLPRCRISSDSSLKKPLTQLGIGSVFGQGADLTALTDASRTIYLADMIHRAAIEIGACNSPASTPRPEGAVGESAVFSADRPFLFVVRDAGTGAIVMMGRVADPTQ